jgi:hypothetical protein
VALGFAMTVKEYGATVEALCDAGDADGILDFAIEHIERGDRPAFSEEDALRLGPAMNFAYRLGSSAKIQRLQDLLNGRVPAATR